MGDPAALATALDPTETTLAALERALRRAGGFALYLIRCNASALRRETLGRLRERLSDLGREVVEIDLDEPVDELVSLLRGRVPQAPSPPLAVSVSGLELSIPVSGEGGILPALNVQRESLPPAVPCPLLVWLPEYAMQRLIVGAPDFYAWRSAEYQLAAAGPGGAASVWRELPGTHWQLGNLGPGDRERRRQALEGMAEELRAQPPSAGRDRDLAKALFDLGTLALARFDLAAAQGLYSESLEIAERHGKDLAAASIYHELGIVAEQRGQLDEAEEWYRKGLAVSERFGDEQGAASAYHQLGMVARERGRLDQAEEWYRKGLEVHLRLGDEHRAAVTYHQLGVIAQLRRRLDEAEEWYRRSLGIHLRLGDEGGAAVTYHQLGIIAQLRCRFSEAEEWCKRGLEIKLRVGDEHGAAMTYGQLGRVAEERRRLDEAEEWYRRALAVFERLDDPNYAEVTRQNLARITGKQ